MSHNTNYCLIKVVTKADLTVPAEHLRWYHTLQGDNLLKIS
jgi:hypothetical protein